MSSLRHFEQSTGRRDLSKSIKDTTRQKQVLTSFNTPFKSRNQSLSHPNIQDHDTKRVVNKLKHFLGKRWNVYHVSPLHNLNYSEVSLKRYARRLKEKLMSRLPSESSVEYEVSYSPFPNLTLNKIDHEAMQISVEKVAESGKTSVAYYAILLSWGATENMQFENSVFLPILLCQGLKNVIQKVHWELQLLHSCYINAFGMHNEDLRIFTIYSFQNSIYNAGDVIKLRYNLPQNPKSGVLDISLRTGILSDLWRCVHGTGTEQWTDAEITTFWAEFHHHTFRSVGFDLGRCGLLMVSLPDVIFTREAVQSSTKEQMYRFLSFLMSLNSPLTSVAPQVHEVVLDD